MIAGVLAKVNVYGRFCQPSLAANSVLFLCFINFEDCYCASCQQKIIQKDLALGLFWVHWALVEDGNFNVTNGKFLFVTRRVA